MASDAPTIYALASGSGVAGIAVIRVSGFRAGDLCSMLTGGPLPAPRYLARSVLSDPSTGEMLDDALVVWMPGPNSFTGEDVVEFHVHGGHATIAALLRVLSAVEGVRLAEPGEFSRRAFEHGRFDLTAAEGINDLVLAETEEQRRQALWQMGGGLSELYERWRTALVRSMALFEANIDFSDEELPDGLHDQAKGIVAAIALEIEDHLNDALVGQAIREGFRIALIGPPNAGKSSLLNCLANDDVAIVSDRPGTTRDVITVRLMLNGYLVELQDTAGLRDANDEIEAEGIRRTRMTRDRANLRCLVLAADEGVPTELAAIYDLREDDAVVLNKIDRLPKDGTRLDCDFYTSVKTGEGISELLDGLSKIVLERLSNRQQVAVTRRRHREALAECLDGLKRFLAFEGGDVAFEAEELRLSARALGRVTGQTGVEDMLDVVFSDFCIGK